MKKFFPFLILITLLSSITKAQQESPDNSGYITYNKIDGYREKYEKGYKFLIKINPFLVINGDMPLYVEKKISEKFSIELGGGATLKDYIFDIFYVDPDVPSTVSEIIDDRKHLVGYSGSAGVRFYPGGTGVGMEGLYIAPEVRYRNYRSQALKCGSQGSFFEDDYIPEYRKVMDFKLIFGSNMYLSDRFFLDWYCGIGLRMREIVQASYCDYSVAPAGTVVLYQNDNRPIISGGVKLGVAF